MKRKILASLAISAALAGGGLAVAAVNPLQLVSAQDGSTTTTQPAAPAPSRATQGPIERALSKLVSNGTITQQQADAVRDAITSEAKGGFLARHPRVRATVGAVKVSADTIGITPKDLMSEVRSGKTVAQVAVEHGKTAQDVIDAIVSAANQRIDQAVSNGKLTQTQADVLTSRVAQRAEHFVNDTPHRASTSSPTA